MVQIVMTMVIAMVIIARKVRKWTFIKRQNQGACEQDLIFTSKL